MTRHYAERKIEELEQLFERGKDEPRIVLELLKELGYRNTPRAQKLKAVVAKHRREVDRTIIDLDAVNLGSLHDDIEYDDDDFQNLDDSEQERLLTAYESLRVKLLDLSKRNRMLNYNVNARAKNQLQIVDEVLEEAYAQLVAGTHLRIDALTEPDLHPADEKTSEFVSALQHAKVADVEYAEAVDRLASSGTEDEVAVERLERALRDRVRTLLGMPARPKRAEINRADHARRLGVDPSVDLPPSPVHSGHKNKFLQTLKYPDELESVLGRVSDQARLAEQEAGLSTLYLAFGFLEWYESEASDKPHYAPLLLLPVRLFSQKVSGKTVYHLEASEEAAETNISLAKFLESNFDRELPALDDDEDDSIVEEYLDEVRKSIEGLRRWKVRRWLMLGHFAFSRIAIYEDTSPDRWPVHPAGHSLVGPLLAGYEDDEDTDANGFGASSDYDIENLEIERIAPILIQDADASQHSALIDVMKGKNLVIQGPPGTGKSQTITNVIANALAASKTVLFLAEKQAALEVVKRRLDIAGVGDFCLELHSDKSSAKAVIENLAARIELGGRPITATVEDPLWREARGHLNRYLGDLHAAGNDGKTAFNLIWEALRAQTLSPDTMSAMKGVEIPQSLLDDSSLFAETIGRLEEYATSAAMFESEYGPFHMSPWSSARPSEIAPYDFETFLSALDEIASAADGFAASTKGFANLGLTDETEIRTAVTAVAKMPTPPQEQRFVSTLKDANSAALADALKLRSTIFELDDAVAPFQGSLGVPRQVLNTAVALAAAVSERDAEQRPGEFFSVAEGRIASNKGFLANFSNLRPALGLLGLTVDDDTRSVVFACRLCELAHAIPEAKRGWIRWKVLDAQKARTLSVEHDQLLAEEEELLSIFPKMSRDSWPANSELEETINILTGSGISRFFNAVSGKSRVTSTRLQAMGFDVSRGDPAMALQRVINHRKRVANFESSQNAYAVGEAWRGIETRFDEIGFSIDVRDLLERLAGSAQGHEKMRHRFLAFSPGELANLARYRELAREVASQISAYSAEATTCRQMVQAIDRWNGSLEAALAADSDRLLADARVSIKTLAEAGRLCADLDKTLALFQRTGLSKLFDSNVVTRPELDWVSEAKEWIDWSAGVPEPLRGALRGPDMRDIAATLSRATASLVEAQERYVNAKDEGRTFGLDEVLHGDPVDVAERCRTLVQAQAQFTEWQSLRRRRVALEGLGLSEFLQKAESIELGPTELVSALNGSVARQRVLIRRRSSEVLAMSTGLDLDTKRRSFAERDRQKIVSDRITLKSTLLGRHAPSGNRTGPVKTFTEMSLIRHEIPKQRRFTPVRTLMSRAGRAIQSLKPCFMMSPLSLAKFLPAKAVSFDLLVIDEASQMRPEDALGAMLRCKQIVVVGDRKQLPPTSFFERSDTSTAQEDDEEDLIDDESILERCQKVFNEVRRLKWHYRSKCESLIRFSNENFYDRSLITFPAAKPAAFSIDLLRVNGTYQVRRNPTEAERIAEEAVEFMRHFSEYNRALPTLGIVAVNTDQRDLIAETLRRLSADDELVDAYMKKAEEKGEPLFVKNLENVQGDERDFIFISLTYGPEPGQTKVKQRFGPINTRTGHRRLNVLFSRARMRMAIFASFGSDDVKPTDASKEGVHILKSYLEYAETRGRSAVEAIGAVADSDFEVEVATRLRKRGYIVDHQVGVTGYKIDLGIRHPDASDRFLAGIECDGAMYHSSKSARDRDRLREEVLGGLGWKLVRVWSTDWFDNPDRETDKLVSRIEAIRRQSPSTNQDYKLRYADPVISSPSKTSEEGPGGVGSEAQSMVEPQTAPESPSTVQSDLHMTAAIDLSALEGSSSLSENEVISLLTLMREGVIKQRMENWEPHRSILRDGMIEALVKQRVTEPQHWFNRVPQYLRSGTDPREKQLFLEKICDIVDRMR
jgi:very-short-patch-repair endonuclease